MEKVMQFITSNYYFFVAAVVVLLLFLFCRWLLEAMKMTPKDANRTIEEIDNMDGREFEQFVAAVLIGNGYDIEEMTATSGDYGADIIATAGEERIAIQCKRYKKPVGLKAVQEVISAMKHYDCETCVVVTNTTFTKQAIQLALDNEVVELWDREILIKLRNQAIAN